MEAFVVSYEVLALLVLIAMVAGIIDTLAGGGGLLVLPALILAGVPPLSALGTNKLQSTMGTATSTFHMFRKRRVTWKQVRYWMLTVFVGSALGTTAVQFVDPSALSFVIPVVLFVIALYFLFSPYISKLIQSRTISNARYSNIVVPSVGFYDGMFGPGTGSFFAFAGVACKGWDLISSTAVAKCLNFSTNVAALVVFVIAGQLVWKIGLCMMLGQLIGASIGANILVRINPQILRVLVVLMCSAMLIRYLFAH